MDYIIFQIDGGAGKNVVATAVVRSIQQKWPDTKIIILTAYPEIWLCNPRVWRVLQIGNAPYFYEDFIKNSDSLILAQEPYKQSDCIYRRKHLSQVWCEMYDLEWTGPKPELYFTTAEKESLAGIIRKEKPLLMIQPAGGGPSNSKYSWARDIPTSLAQTIVDEFKQDYRILQIKREDQILIPGAEPIVGSHRMIAMSLLFSDKRILIDSVSQHVAASFDLPSYVFWIGNSPTTFGYGIHNNIVTNFQIGSLRHSMYDPFDIGGDPLQLLTPPHNLFDTDQVIAHLKGPLVAEEPAAPAAPEFSNDF